MQVVDVLDGPVLERRADGDVVEEREVLHAFAEPDSAGMFIVLLAALEGQDLEPIEAATVDGASRWQIFRYITMPAIFPVALTIVLLRLIEAFKIIDLPNVLTSGGPGTATESLTLQSYFQWRSLDLGVSAATANSLLILVTIIAVVYVTLLRRRVVDEGAAT